MAVAGAELVAWLFRAIDQSYGWTGAGPSSGGPSMSPLHPLHEKTEVLQTEPVLVGMQLVAAPSESFPHHMAPCLEKRPLQPATSQCLPALGEGPKAVQAPASPPLGRDAEKRDWSKEDVALDAAADGKCRGEGNQSSRWQLPGPLLLSGACSVSLLASGLGTKGAWLPEGGAAILQTGAWGQSSPQSCLLQPGSSQPGRLPSESWGPSACNAGGEGLPGHSHLTPPPGLVLS